MENVNFDYKKFKTTSSKKACCKIEFRKIRSKKKLAGTVKAAVLPNFFNTQISRLGLKLHFATGPFLEPLERIKCVIWSLNLLLPSSISVLAYLAGPQLRPGPGLLPGGQVHGDGIDALLKQKVRVCLAIEIIAIGILR